MYRAAIILSIVVAVASAGCGESGGGSTSGGAGTGAAGGVGGSPPILGGVCCWVDEPCRESSADACNEIAGTFIEAQSCGEVTCPAATTDGVRQSAEAIEVLLRNDYPLYIDAVSTIGREYWNLNDVDPRYTGELLGKAGTPLEPDGSFNVGTFAARYRVILQGAR